MSNWPESAGRRVVVHLEGAISVVNQFPALAGVDLEIGEGEIVLVQGPNGAGKSTLLRLLSGLTTLAAGQGRVLDHDLADPDQRRALRREAGLLAHETYLYDELTVAENVGFWAEANRVDPTTIEPVLDRLELGERLRTVRVGDLSAGQRRRTSLAVLVCRRPRLWLLDEPHGGLDRAGRDLVDDLIGHAVRFGATVVFASHDLDRAESVATRTVTLAGGQVVAPGARSRHRLAEERDAP